MRPSYPLRMSRLSSRFVYRENKVPYYQRLYQRPDNLRMHEKTAFGRAYYKFYLAMMFFTTVSSCYAMGRLIMGHKTWFGKD